MPFSPHCRFPDRRRGFDGPRGSWSEAAVDILEQQFGYSRDALQEMLELHEGNLEVALDMLAQLEAEKDGQLPASGQVRNLLSCLCVLQDMVHKGLHRSFEALHSASRQLVVLLLSDFRGHVPYRQI